MRELTVFTATFATVFALGFQSLNVNNGHFVAAAMTSFVIGSTHLVLYRMLPDGSLTECLAFLIAGPLAITSSMWAHRHYRLWSARRAGGLSDAGLCRQCLTILNRRA